MLSYSVLYCAISLWGGDFTKFIKIQKLSNSSPNLFTVWLLSQHNTYLLKPFLKYTALKSPSAHKQLCIKSVIKQCLHNHVRVHTLPAPHTAHSQNILGNHAFCDKLKQKYENSSKHTVYSVIHVVGWHISTREDLSPTLFTLGDNLLCRCVILRHYFVYDIVNNGTINQWKLIRFYKYFNYLIMLLRILCA